MSKFQLAELAKDMLQAPTSYREFRAIHMPEKYKKLLMDGVGRSMFDRNSSAEKMGFSQRKKSIKEYRAEISWSASHNKEFLYANQVFVCKALGIPDFYVSQKSWLVYLLQFLYFWLPSLLKVMIIRKIFTDVRTFEGRDFVYRKFFKGPTPGALDWYTDTLDYAIKNLKPTARHAQISDISKINIHWLKLVNRLGAYNWTDVIESLRGFSSYSNGEFEEMLVAEGVIITIDELGWIKNVQNGKSTPYHHSDGEAEVEAARKVVRQLLKSGISRKLISNIGSYSYPGFNDTDLEKKLKLMRDYNIDLNLLFKSLGPLLWKVTYEKFHLVVGLLGFRNAENFAKFKGFLDSGKKVNLQFLNCYVQQKATEEDFIKSEPLISKVNSMEDDGHSASVFGVLAEYPYYFSLKDIVECQRYICEPGDLKGYLAVLHKNNIVSKEDIVLFQSGYPARDLIVQDRYLNLAVPRCKLSERYVASQWVNKAVKQGYLHELEYLIERLQLTKLNELQSILRLSDVSIGVLKFVIERKAVHNLEKLIDWYYRHASGVKEVSISSNMDLLDNILLENAFENERFSILPKNQSVIAAEVRRRVNHNIDGIPYENGVFSEIYKVKEAELTALERQHLVPIISQILPSTGGVLLPSFFVNAGQESWCIEKSINSFKPLLENLVSGAGPKYVDLSQAESEAISLVYGVSLDRIKNHWEEVVNENKDVIPLQPQNLAWQRSERRLKRLLDRNGFSTIVNAVVFARNFQDNYKTDMGKACCYLSPRRLQEQSRDTSTLSQHLGVLLAICTLPHHTNWSLDFFEKLAKISDDDSSYETVSSLKNFFEIGLKDALNDSSRAFIAGLSKDKRIELSNKILLESSPHEKSDDPLLGALNFAQDIICLVYGKWVNREFKKYESASVNTSKTQIYGVVSSHPAAFFAPIATGICTGGDIQLWREERFSMFLMFDRKENRFAGMVYLFKHMIEYKDTNVNVLIFRAVNIIPAYSKIHDLPSIIDSIVEALITYAQNNQYHALAICANSGQHLLSNDSSMESAILKRLIRSKGLDYHQLEFDTTAETLIGNSIPVKTKFAAYSEGREVVDEIFIVWKDQLSAQFE